MPASKRFRILTMAAALVLLAAAPAAAQATWAQVPSPNRPGSNELQGADGADPSLVWAVGRVVDTGGNPSTYRSLILRWNGSAWAQAPHPSFARNHALRGAAAPAADDAWAVGTRQVASGGLVTLVERWDGATWRTVASPNPDPGGLNELNGVAGVPSAPGTVWAVGSHSTPNANFGTRKLILRRTVGGWQVLGSPTFTPEDHLEAVDASGPAAAWAVGWGSTSPFGGTAVGIALRWNGSGWRSVPIPQPSPVMLFGVAALAPTTCGRSGTPTSGAPTAGPLASLDRFWNPDIEVDADRGAGQLADPETMRPDEELAWRLGKRIPLDVVPAADMEASGALPDEDLAVRWGRAVERHLRGELWDPLHAYGGRPALWAAAIRDEVARRVDARVEAIAAEPPAYVIAAVGPRPAEEDRGAEWLSRVEQIEEYRLLTGTTDPTHALGGSGETHHRW
jgi:hypothetical protein